LKIVVAKAAVAWADWAVWVAARLDGAVAFAFQQAAGEALAAALAG
jgi:hypothetical protein